MSQDDLKADAGEWDPENEMMRMLDQGRSFSARERHCFFLNTTADTAAGGRFANISAVSGFDFPDDGRAVALVDWDHDGDQDMWISNRNAPRLRLMRNDTGGGNHFLALRLQGDGKTINRDAIGARVEVLVGDSKSELRAPRTIQSLRAGEGYLAQSSKWLHFGLGLAEAIEKVIVHWPGGGAEEFSDLAVDRRYLLVQGSGQAVDQGGPARQTILAPSEQKALVPTQVARIPMVHPLTVPRLRCRSLEGKDRTLPVKTGGHILVNLWASWCAPCLAELSEFSERHEEMKAKGLEVLALSVDGLGPDPSAIKDAKRIATKGNFPFLVGQATAPLLDDFQALHDIRIALHPALPLPSSFLIDPEGRLSVIYKGPVSVDQLLADVGHSEGKRIERWARAAPLGGMPLSHARVAKRAMDWGATLRILFAHDLIPTNRPDDVAEQYADVIETHPDLFETRYNLGNMLQRMNRLEESIVHYREAARLKKDYSEAHNNLGNVLARLNRFPEATEQYREALRIKPDLPRTQYNFANLLQKMGQLEDAVAHFEEAVRLKPDFAEARYNFGNLLFRMKRSVEAVEQYREAVRIRPDYASAYNNMGGALNSAGRPEEAVVAYGEAVRSKPDFAEAHYNLGSTLEDLGRYEEAKPYFREAYRINPKLRNRKAP